MKAFANVIVKLGTSTKTNDKLDALSYYFATANDADKVWVIALFSGRRPKRIISSGFLQLWCMEAANLPAWLFEECYHTVGDLAETIALLLPPPQQQLANTSLSFIIQKFVEIEKQEEAVKKEVVIAT